MPVSPQTRYRVVRLMKLYRREMLPRMDQVLTNFEADPDAAVAAVVQNYGPEPEHEPLRLRVTRFLAKHDNSSVGDVDSICKAYTGRDAACMSTLCDKYSVPYEPDPPTPRRNAGPASKPPPGADGNAAAAVDADGVPTDMSMGFAAHKSALASFYKRYGVSKTDREIDASLKKFTSEGGQGVEKMWQILRKKYAAENQTVAKPARERQTKIQHATCCLA